MVQIIPLRRSYDHRIREIVCQTGNPRIFQHLRIPRSTAASWISRGCRTVVSLDQHHDIAAVLDENEKLNRRVLRQTAIIRLLVVLLRVSGFRLDKQRLPDGISKAKVLRVVERCKNTLPLRSALRVLRLSPARYYAWKQAFSSIHEPRKPGRQLRSDEPWHDCVVLNISSRQHLRT